MTADEILDVLERTYSRHPGHMLFLREFPLQAGARVGRGGTTRIDALVIGIAGGHYHRRTAYEVKTDRRDFLRELGAPEKRQPAIAISDEFYFAMPEGLVTKDEVPPECGLIEVSEHGPVIIKNAPLLKPKDLDWSLTMDIARRAFQLGQQDWAKREPLAGWFEVRQLVEACSHFRADPDESLEALRSLSQRMRGSGRMAEARHIDAAARKLRQRIDASLDDKA